MIKICGTCNTILNEDYKFKHFVINYNDYEKIVSNVEISKTELIKLATMIIFVEKGNVLIIKNKNGKANTGVYNDKKVESFLSETKRELNLTKILKLSDWVDSFANIKHYALLSDILYDLATFSGFLNKLKGVEWYD